MNTLVRAFVLALAVTGAVASATAPTSTFGVAHVASKLHVGPPPVCPPDGSTDCGFGGGAGN